MKYASSNGSVPGTYRNPPISVLRYSLPQARVLKSIAVLGGKSVFSKEFLASSATYNASSVKVAVGKLENEEIIYSFNGEFKFINPFFGEWVRRM